MPSSPPLPLLLVLCKGSSLLRSDVPTSQWQCLPLKQGSSLLGGGAPRVKWKSPRKGTPSTAGYCKRPPSTKQQKAGTGAARLPGRKQPHGPPLRRRGKSTEAAGEQGAGQVRPSGRSGKPTISMREGKARTGEASRKGISVLGAPLEGLGR